MRTVLIGIYSPAAAWNLPVAQVERLRREFPGSTFLHATSDAEAMEHIRQANVAFVPDLAPGHFRAAARLGWIHSPAAGIGGMLFPEMLASPVVMTNSRGLSADTIAEHVIAVTLAMFRRLPEAIRSQDARLWAQASLASPVRMIAGTRVSVVGLGSIGAATARRFAALDATVTGIRRNLSRPAPAGVTEVLPPGRLMDALPHADVVVLAAPQTSRTRGLIGAGELAAMRSDALLVNVSRGKLVDEKALIDALQRGTIGGAALDVFEEEPLPPDSPLWQLPNVLVTPHIAGFRPNHWDAVTDLFAANLRRFMDGAPLLNVVDKEHGY